MIFERGDLVRVNGTDEEYTVRRVDPDRVIASRLDEFGDEDEVYFNAWEIHVVEQASGFLDE